MEFSGRKRRIVCIADTIDKDNSFKTARRDNAGITLNNDTEQNGRDIVYKISVTKDSAGVTVDSDKVINENSVKENTYAGITFNSDIVNKYPVKSDNVGITVNTVTEQTGREVLNENAIGKKSNTFKRGDSGYSSTSDFEDEDDVICSCDVNVTYQSGLPLSVQGHSDWRNVETTGLEQKRSRLRSLQKIWNVRHFCSTLKIRFIYLIVCSVG